MLIICQEGQGQCEDREPQPFCSLQCGLLSTQGKESKRDPERRGRGLLGKMELRLEDKMMDQKGTVSRVHHLPWFPAYDIVKDLLSFIATGKL